MKSIWEENCKFDKREDLKKKDANKQIMKNLREKN